MAILVQEHIAGDRHASRTIGINHRKRSACRRWLRAGGARSGSSATLHPPEIGACNADDCQREQPNEDWGGSEEIRKDDGNDGRRGQDDQRARRAHRTLTRAAASCGRRAKATAASSSSSSIRTSLKQAQEYRWLITTELFREGVNG